MTGKLWVPIFRENNIFHYSYLLLLTSFFVRLLNNGILQQENVYFSLLSYSLIVISFVVQIRACIKYKNIIYILFILFVFLMVQPTTFRASFLVIMYTLYISKNCNFKYVITTTLLFSMVSIFAIFCFINMGLAENNAWRTVAGRGHRYDLGFNNPNAAPLFLGGILMLMAYAIKLRTDKKSAQLFFIISASLVVYLVFYATGSRTLVASWIIFCLTIIFKRIFINSISIAIIRIFPIFIFVLFFLLAVNIENNVVRTVDQFLSYRIRLYGFFFSHFSIIDMIFGNAQLVTTLMEEERAPLDSAYMLLFFTHGGIVYLLFYFVIYRRGINYFISNKDYLAISILIFFLVFAMAEAIFMGVTYFPNLFFWILLSNIKPISKLITKDNVGFSEDALNRKIFSQNVC